MLFNIAKNNNVAEKNSKILFRVWLALLTDVDIDNFPAAVNATISTNILLAGKTWKYIDCRVDTIKPSTAAGASPYDGKQTIPIVLDGISKQILAWIYANLGLDVVIIWERCSDRQKFIAGSPCSSGLKIKLKSIGEVNNIAGAELSLEGGDCPEPFWFYDGEVVLEDPTVVNLGADTTFAIGTGSQYEIADNAAAKSLTDITGVTDGDVGRIIELVGASVNHPALIETSTVFILNAGLSFSAKVGNSISFQITKTDGGYAFYEVDRR